LLLYPAPAGAGAVSQRFITSPTVLAWRRTRVPCVVTGLAAVSGESTISVTTSCTWISHDAAGQLDMPRR